MIPLKQFMGLRTSMSALLSARSHNVAEVSDALATLVVTNFAMAITTLSLGFGKQPALSLYEYVCSKIDKGYKL
jgi:hypothetical protein